ncbi:MAG: DUF4330 domain-containing protein [Firmicutes bacterium]|nr:DUF4330 domain-containing protein [Bacillota bacterium]
MLDEKGRLFGKISVIDLIVILGVVILVAGFVYNRTSQNIRQIIAAETPIYVTFEVENVRDFSFASVEIGDTIFRQHERIPLGQVVQITQQPTNEITITSDGTAIYAPVENRYNMHITILATGSITDAGFFVNGTQQMATGGTMALQSNRFLATVRIFDVSADF